MIIFAKHTGFPDEINTIEIHDDNIDESIDYINDNKIEAAQIITGNIYFLDKCPSLKYLNILPSVLSPKLFDYSPLYRVPNIISLSCGTSYVYNNKDKAGHGFIDYSRIKGLRYLTCAFNKYEIGASKVSGLQGITAFNWPNEDLINFSASNSILLLQLGFGRMQNLKGINDCAPSLKCLLVFYSRYLTNISHIVSVNKSLTALSIENCPNIEDLSVIGELENLEFLKLLGGRKIKSFGFLKKCKNLKTFVTDYKSEDGDMAFIKNLSNAYLPCCRHYNIKPKDLPNGKFYMGTDGLPWNVCL
ncbi:MAG: hypothetical protein J5563_08175 [Clostridia bacterium]|nr:hypothetical protein [Clostridia bacterium]